ncbi:MAG: hypothetical protein WCQ87_03510 [Parabacteroides sp.]
MSTIANKYFVKQGLESYADFTTKWVGLTILGCDKIGAQGKAKNIYTRSHINSNTEDVHIPDVVYFENPDVNINFLIRDLDDHSIDVRAVHNSFITYMTTHQVTIKSLYENLSADFVCLAEYKPTQEATGRVAGHNYILGTLPMHRVTAPITATS